MKNIMVKGKKDGVDIDIQVSRLILGLGSLFKIHDTNSSIEILEKFVELGGTTFDTARHYRDSEKDLGKWIKEKNNRDKVVIFTKGGHPVREFPNISRVKPECISEDINKSLEMLNTNYIDLFALHRDDRTVPVGKIMEELDKHIKAGKIYAIGASNWEIDRIEEANLYAEQNGLTKFTFTSPNLSLAKCKIPRWENCVSADNKIIEWHKKNNMPLISWSSQAGGFFSGRFSPENPDNEEMVAVYYCDDNWERYSRAEQLAKKLGVGTIQVALAYVLNQKFDTAAVIGSENINELISSYRGESISLDEDTIEWLDLIK
ncbi:aldo/keto reductase [Clostridium sp. AL.422]|uniref:aldo/keto reductase n=1 Tax=Clostridium TaxID=1485 RepID=UPI00293DB21D|nr:MULTISPECIES: aldo/keto reductase [unclassified Clostridium]MDV4151380.1 aldo/keto reductase [Clostridium sp. AL.422]